MRRRVLGSVTTRAGRTAAVALAATFAVSSCTGLSVNRPVASHEADARARPGGTIVVGIQRPASIDPGNISERNGALVASLICEPLVQIDPATTEVANGLIDNVVTGGNGTRFTIRLREGVRFHDGKTLTAQDVVYSLSRVARHDFAGAQADVLRPVAGYEVIHAPLPPTESGDPTKRTLAGVRAISSTALEITLGQPNAEFLRALSLPLAAPVPQRLPDREPGFAQQPVCTGPYRLARPFRPGDDVIELERFADYYANNTGFSRGGASYPDRIRFRILPSLQAEVREFEAGHLDIAHVAPDLLRESRKTGPNFMTSSAPSIEFVGLPTNRAPFDDAGVRAILSRAIDRRRLVADVFEGGRLPADRFLPPSLGSFPAAPSCTTNIPPAGDSSRPDADMLSRLRSERHVLKVNSDFRNRALAEAIARQWREKLGLDVRIDPLSWTSYLTQATSAQGIDALFRESWTPAYPSIDAVLHPLFHSSQIGSNNWARFNERTFDRRLDRIARREQTDELRRVKYLSLEQILCTELPLIPLTFGQEEYLVRTATIGAATQDFFDRTTGQPLLRELYVREA